MGLGKGELLFYFAVWIGHATYALWKSFVTSQEFKPDFLEYRFLRDGWSAFGGFRDYDMEWDVYLEDLRIRLPLLVLHALIFNGLKKLIDESTKLFWLLMIAVWLFFHYCIHGWMPIFWSFLLGVFLLILLRSQSLLAAFIGVRNSIRIIKIAIWATVLSWLYWMAEQDLDDETLNDYSASMKRWGDNVLYAYKTFQFISFTMDLLNRVYKSHENPDNHSNEDRPDSGRQITKDENKLPSFLQSGYLLLRYSLYFPLTTVLIVQYEQFETHIRKPDSVNWKSIAFLAIRILFWITVTDIFLHQIYVNIFMKVPYFLQQMDLQTLTSIGYIAGQFFHLKYVSIFGIPTIFAYIDGMYSPWPTVCISRISLYSRMWKYFDRGLYGILKKYIFGEIAPRGSAMPMQLVATSITFGFVWVWHGMSTAYKFWVLLNLIEVTLERIAKFIWIFLQSSGRYGHFGISDTAILRLTAIGHVPCVTLGVISISYFLGENEGQTGHIFLFAILIDNPLGLAWLWALGYCYAHCCIALEEGLGFRRICPFQNSEKLGKVPEKPKIS